LGPKRSFQLGTSERKKKELVPSPDSLDPDLRRAQSYRSIFDQAPAFHQDSKPLFFPADAFAASFAMEAEELPLDLENASTWDMAIRYHEIKSKRSARDRLKYFRKLSATAILERAQDILGSVVHPLVQRVAPWSELPAQAEQSDLDLDETIENSPLGIADLIGEGTKYPLTKDDVWMSYSIHRRQPIILCVDTSLSMTGEKLALTAVALAVVLLEFPEDPIGIVAFENEAKILKSPDERLSVHLLVERFLDVPAQGYTHLEDGMKAALHLMRAAQSGGQGRPPSVVLLTDGKYTAGRDPAYLAPRFPHLVVLKMGRERASHELCLELAKKGKGSLREVDDLERLPATMYGVVKDMLR
jgi:Mg-chelatase subunit ChlD